MKIYTKKGLSLAELLVSLILVGIITLAAAPLFKMSNVKSILHRTTYYQLKRATNEILLTVSPLDDTYCTELISLFNTIGDTSNSCTAATGTGEFVLSNGVTINMGIPPYTYPITLMADLNGSDGPNNPTDSSTYDSTKPVDRMFFTITNTGEIKPDTDNGTTNNDAIDDNQYEIIRANVLIAEHSDDAAAETAIAACTYTPPGGASTPCRSLGVSVSDAAKRNPVFIAANVRYDEAQALKTAIEGAGGTAYINYKSGKLNIPIFDRH